MKIPLRIPAAFAAVLFLTLAAITPALAQEKAGWTDDQAKALEMAKADKKMVLMDFTGSDWCSWCMKMDKEVFDTPEFKQYAKDHLVLVMLDYPRQKTVAPLTKQQNEKLKSDFGVQGYPTMVVLDADGKKVKEFVGYQEGGPKAFIAELEKLKS